MLPFPTVLFLALILVLAAVLTITLIIDYRYETHSFQLSTLRKERLRKYRRKWLTACSVFMLIMVGCSVYFLTQLF